MPDDGSNGGSRLARSFRFVVAGVICWAALIGGALALISIKNTEAADARHRLPSPSVTLSPRNSYMWAHFPQYRDVVPILAYHGVNNDDDYLSVTRKKFAEQLQALKLGGFHTISIAQYAHYAATGDTSQLPQNPILLTFDDGRLDSYQGADASLERFHDQATMFVVAAWPEERPDWALHWSELAKMQESGRWDIQEHAGSGHHHIVIGPHRKQGEYYADLRWEHGALESFDSYEKRVVTDIKWGEQMFREHIPDWEPLAFAVPYSNYGQRATNDPRIPEFFFHFIHSQFPVLVDGDYLDFGPDRPSEIKGRGGHRISYRITQGGASDTLPLLECRLRDFVLEVPLWREYSCLKSSGGQVPSEFSE